MNARESLVHAVYPEAEGPGTNELIDAYRAEVLAEAKIETVAWLVKKAAEQQTWDAAVLASKIDRGAVRAFIGTAHYRDAMDAHRAQVLNEAADELEAIDPIEFALGTIDPITELRRMAHGDQKPAGNGTQPAPDLTARIYDSLATFNATACWDVLRLAQMRQYLAEHVAGSLADLAGPDAAYADTRGEPGESQ